MKLMKKIAPFVTSALLVGATAAAADLATWKSNFPGAETAIVVGAASTQGLDSLGAVDIAAALTVTTTSTTSQPVANAHLMQSAGNSLEFYETFYDIDPSLDDSDLPNLLMEGKYRESRGETENDVTYTQKIEFDDTGVTTLPVFAALEEGKKTADNYLFLDDGAEAYTYSLKFDDAVEYDDTSATTVKEDFELTKLSLLGREYTITDAKDSGAGIDEMTLMAGAAKATQYEYSNATYTIKDKTYNVEVPIISDDDSSVILKINGETTDEMNEGDTYTLDDDTVVGIVDVVPNEGAEKSSGTSEGNDIVTFYLGAEKMLLKDGQEVEMNGEAVDGSNVELNPTAGEVTEIDFSFTPDENVFLKAGESWTDPVLGRLKYTFQGIEKNTEDIALTSDGDDGEIKVTNNAGKELDIPVVFDDVAELAYFGDELDDGTYWTLTVDGSASYGNFAIGDGDICTPTTSTEDCEGLQFLAVSSGGEAHIIEITDIDDTDHEITFKDVTRGKTFDPMEYTSGVALTADLGWMDVHMTITDDTSIVLTTINEYDVDNSFQTSLAGDVELSFTGADAEVYLYNNEDDVNTGNYMTYAYFETDADATPEMAIYNDDSELTCGRTLTSGTTCDLEKDSDYKVAIDDGDATDDGYPWGLYVKWDNENDDDLTFTYPEEQVVAKAYVSEDLTSIPELGIGTSSGIAPIAVQDSDIANVQTKNIIAVGGSAINSVAAKLIGVPFPTYGTDAAWTSATGVDASGKAIVKLMDSPYTTGKFAMLVAGWEGVDTTRATAALRYGTPALSGTSAKLNTATSTVTVISS